MICSSCGARVDPDRSFCSRCGSAVFLEGPSAAIRRVTSFTPAPPTSVSPTSIAHAASSEAATAVRTVKRVPMRMKSGGAAPRFEQTRRGGGFLSLVRLAIFLGVAWYVIVTVAKNPDFDDTLKGLRSDDNPILTHVIDFVRQQAGHTDTPAPAAKPILDAAASPPAHAPNTPARIYELRDGITPPKATVSVRAQFPDDARRAGIQGTVTVKATVEPDGSVSDVTVVKSLDTKYGVDDAAVAAVRRWQFTPGIRDGEPVRAYAYVELPFRARPSGR